MSNVQQPIVADRDAAGAEWFKSSYSDAQGQGDCVRVSTSFVASHCAVLVGDTKTPGVHLAVSPAAWRDFVAAAAAGEFGG
ncbi:DUF397 domain-containing protein [Kitasatospora sp. NPDC050543]|uniref:DUF397 domain-containing protein n=1 Tax=Kitasatospora sp. NPDC050543 TaxID=3364054 RepID=UPI00378ED1B2